MDRDPQPQHAGLPSLTPEERRVLYETRKEAFTRRVVPLLVISTGFTYFKFRSMSASPIMKFATYGTVSIVSFFAGIASYGSEFRRRIDALENSPLRDALRQRSSEGKTFPGMSQGPYSPGSPQAPETGPFVNTRDTYSNFQTNDRRNRPGGQSDYDRFSPRTSYDPYSSNDRYDNRFNVSDDQSPHSDGYLNQDSAASPYNFAFEDRNQSPPTSAGPSPENQKYMSYKDRRAYYRNNPGVKGEIDPFSNAKSRPSNPNAYSHTHASPSYPNNNYQDQPEGTAERPFIPFFNEGSYGESNDKTKDRKSF